jgi:outer membrane protein assembly factor BamB
MKQTGLRIAIRAFLACGILALAGCSVLDSLPFFGRGSEKPKPEELQPNPALISVRPAWTARIGQVTLPLTVAVNGSTVTVASSDGTVAAIDGATGRDLWRTNIKAPIAAGVGSDGRMAAVVTGANEAVALSGGSETWREKLSAVAYTAPFVAGARVFVLTADRAVTAFDGATGRKLWTQQRTGEPLVLRQSGVILAVGDTLVVGLAGRMVGLNPLNGSVRWESAVATPRGINDVERLVDLVGTVSRVGDVVCTRAFQTAVGCVDASRGSVLWTKPANGANGVGGDENFVFGSESDGKVIAWRRDNGEHAWVNEHLRYRGLTSPLALGRSVIVGDSTGLVHFLSRQDGTLLNRVTTDGSAIAAAPVVAGNTLVVVTHNGDVFGFTPD